MTESVVLERFLASTARRAATGTQALKRQRIYIAPTRHGLVFGLMLMAMFLGAVNYNNSMAYVFTFLLGSLALITILHTYHNLAGLAIDSATPAAVFAGDLAYFPFILDNRGGQLRLSVVLAKISESESSKPKNSKPRPEAVISGMITANQCRRFELPVKTEKRGLLLLERVKIFTTFPLGLFQAWAYIETQQSCLVYPKPQGQATLPPLAITDVAGLQGKQAGTDDFVGFRNYRAGDPIRDIAWKAYAQEKGLMVKRFQGSGSNKLILTWADVSQPASVEARLSQLCLWIIEAEARSFQYGLQIPGTDFKPAHGAAHKQRCLAALAHYGLSS